MLRTPAAVRALMSLYSELALLLGAALLLSPRLGKAMMLRVLLVVPLLLVTHTSTRFMDMPVVTVGSVAIHPS